MEVNGNNQMKINGGKFRSLRPAVNIVVLRPMVSRLLPVSSLRLPFLTDVFRLCLQPICTSHFRIMTQYLLSLGAPALGARTLGPKEVHKPVISVTVGWVTWSVSGWVRARQHQRWGLPSPPPGPSLSPRSGCGTATSGATSSTRTCPRGGRLLVCSVPDSAQMT